MGGRWIVRLTSIYQTVPRARPGSQRARSEKWDMPSNPNSTSRCMPSLPRPTLVPSSSWGVVASSDTGPGSGLSLHDPCTCMCTCDDVRAKAGGHMQALPHHRSASDFHHLFLP